MRWLLVVGLERSADFGLDWRDELRALGHEVTTFAYRRENVLYRNRSTKPFYQRLILAQLERRCAAVRPDVVLVLKGGPITAEVIERTRARTGSLFLNVFPDNPLWMIPFEHIEPYDLFFTKERYAMRQLALAGLDNLYYLPLYCVPAFHHPVPVPSDQVERLGRTAALVGRRYPYRERLVAELAGLPVKVWGPGWNRAADARVRAMVAGRGLWGRDKLVVYSGATISLNPHHPMNDIVGVNIRAFELAAAGACQVVDLKEDLPTLFKPGHEVVTFRDRAELRQQIEYYVDHPDEARAIGDNARERALAEHTLRHRIEEIVAVVQHRFDRR